MADQAKAERKPYVAIFGDSKDQATTKRVWTLLSSFELKLASVSTLAELENIVPDAVLILIKIQDLNDNNVELARMITENPRAVANIFALVDEADPDEKIKILAKGFDAIFHTEILDYPEFKQVLLNSVEKGFVSLENRIQQEEYHRFKAALSASPNAFIVFDQNNKIFFVSEHYQNAYPLSGPRMLRGVDVMDAFEMAAAEEGVDIHDSRYIAMRSFWSQLDGEIEFPMNNGRIWQMKAKKLPGGQGTIVTTIDITRFRNQQTELERKTMELANALEKEQEASNIQKQFINMISHEFRTPLAIIDGNAQILQRRVDTLDGEQIKKRSKTIRSAVSRLVNMMEGVLSSNMLKTGKLHFMPTNVDLKALIHELCDEYSDLYSACLIRKEIDELPGQLLLDSKLITLVISNLLSNAIKFSSEKAEIIVRGYTEGGLIRIEFEDNGIGIPASEIQKIFDRFYRATTASGVPGSGIGLSLVKDLIDLHGGKVDVESTMGQGSKFVIFLPLSHNS